jgi:hypothetical protein
MRPALRYLSYVIDTLLLASAIVLLVILPSATFANHWLAVKLALIGCYIVLGSVALKRGRTPMTRRVSFAVACLVYGAILAVAHTHDPLGPVRLLLDDKRTHGLLLRREIAARAAMICYSNRSNSLHGSG